MKYKVSCYRHTQQTYEEQLAIKSFFNVPSIFGSMSRCTDRTPVPVDVFYHMKRTTGLYVFRIGI